MAVFFNRVLKVNPRDPQGGEKKWYATLKSVGHMDEHAVARLISDETTLNPKEAEMAIYQLEKVMGRLLLNGYTVQIGEFGSFSLTANSIGCKDEIEVTGDTIKRVRIVFRASRQFKALLKTAKFKPVTEMLPKKH